MTSAATASSGNSLPPLVKPLLLVGIGANKSAKGTLVRAIRRQAAVEG